MNLEVAGASQMEVDARSPALAPSAGSALSSEVELAVGLSSLPHPVFVAAAGVCSAVAVDGGECRASLGGGRQRAVRPTSSTDAAGNAEETGWPGGPAYFCVMPREAQTVLRRLRLAGAPLADVERFVAGIGPSWRPGGRLRGMLAVHKGDLDTLGSILVKTFLD